MRPILIFFGLISLTAVVMGDDTEALRHTISSLCSFGGWGDFSACCRSYSANSIVLNDRNTWSCFIKNLTVTEDFALTHLDFSLKDVPVLPNNVFSGLTNLEVLDLGSNDITSIESGAFNSLSNLVSLDLNGCFLGSLPSGLFNGLNNLTDLDLGMNGFESLPSGIFSGLNSLLSLRLYFNRLTSIDPDFFNGLTLLEDLNLGTNSLSSLDKTVFSNLRNLDGLDLSGNQLTSLPSGIFDNNRNIMFLQLDHNKLTSLPNGVFSQLNYFAYLDLRYNSLTYFDLGRNEPFYALLESNYLVSFHHDDSVVNDDTLRMTLTLDKNCLIESQIPSYVSSDVRISKASQTRCPEGTCENKTLRESGCFMCSGNGGDNNCVSCLEGYILYNGMCVKCLSMEVCPFNNTDKVYCVNDDDLTHCDVPNSVKCLNHVCVDHYCGNHVVEKTEECDGSEHCGGDCKCEEGYAVDETTPGVCAPKKTSNSSHTQLGILVIVLSVVITFFF